MTLPVNRWLISRGRGHAVVHAYHGRGHEGSDRPTTVEHVHH
ncbi:hypothetical protein [Geodermatophilus obscurus]